MSGNIEPRGMKSIEPKIGEYGLRAESARSIRKILFPFLLSLTLLFVSSCATVKTAKFTTSELIGKAAKTKILILKPHVAIHEMAMGGLIELKADWTEAATKNLNQALKEHFQDKNIAVKFPKNPPEQKNANTQARQLLDAVGKSIFSHYYFPNQHLPSKKEFNWSVGKIFYGFDGQFDPDYILYVSIEATLASGNRQALALVTALVFGAAIPTGHSQGIAYLVETKSGDIVWYNRTSGGAMRELKTAKIAIRNVLSDFPK